ncbi:MAG: PD40 domain-containing protein [Bacteroidetes bacterium]|nr:PD40 domain-containing protein [Bacteroidota bacterium]
MKTKILVIALLMNAFGSFAHDKNDFDIKYKKANEEYKAGNYFQALPMYMEVYRMDSMNANLNYLVGSCHLKARSGKANAMPYLERASRSITPNYKEESVEEKGAPILTYKLLGDAYHIHSKFDKAIQSYENYNREMLFYKKKDSENTKDANRKMTMCRIGKKLMAAPVKVKIENMGKALNSPYGDYSPVLTADQSTMIFTSRRSSSTGGQTYDGGRFFEDIYISHYANKEWSVAENIGGPINTNENEASVGVSPDGQEILIYKDDNGDGNIYSTTLNGDTWSAPVKLNSNINSKHWEPSAFISADGRTIYFSSDRPGGFGGRDIYASEKTEDGEWGKAVNMGALINSEYDEDSPFIHPDGITLFFSSNGNKTMGGFDIFYSSLSDNGSKWLEPVNVGYPVNSPDDDIFYVVSTDKTKAYYTSFKEGGYGEKDNYTITFLDQKKAPLTLVKGIVKDAYNAVPKEILITVTDNETEKVIGVYKPNSKTGQYMFILTPGKNYNISYDAEGFLFYSENRYIAKNTNYYELYKVIELPPVIVGSKIALNNIFFDFDKAILRKTSNVELKNILRLLTRYPNMVIEIGAYTDSKGTGAYNEKLSKERANAVVNFIIEKGIAKERLVASSYGETMPAAPNENTDGSDNAEGRQLNRRVELKILKLN